MFSLAKNFICMELEKIKNPAKYKAFILNWAKYVGFV